jgi:hypothetical protein
MENQTFDNENRNRYYGKRIGDIVKIKSYYSGKYMLAEVVGYGFMNNNALKYIILDDKDTVLQMTAEDSDILLRVEDRHEFQT